MPDAIKTIELAVHGAGTSAVDWREVATAVAELSQHATMRQDDAEKALVNLIDPKNTINVSAYELPHSQSPADMLRAAAIDVLWQLTGQKYAALCAQVAAGPVSPIVKRLVAARFPEAVAAADAAAAAAAADATDPAPL